MNLDALFAGAIIGALVSVIYFFNKGGRLR